MLAFPAHAVLIVAAGFALIAACRDDRSPWGAPLGLGLAVAAYLLWRCAAARDTALAWADAGGIAAGAAAALTGALCLGRNDARFIFLAVCVTGGFVQAAVAILQITSEGRFALPFWISLDLREFYAERFSVRARGFFLNPNQFSWLMNGLALLAVAFGCWARVRLGWRILLLYATAVFAVMSVLAASRGGVLSLGVGLGVFLILSFAAIVGIGRGRRLVLLVGGGIASLLAIGAAYATFSTSWVAQGRFDSLLQDSLRSDFQQQAWRAFQANPLLGNDPGSFRYAARLYRDSGLQLDPLFAHNDWLQLLAEYGFVGMALVVLLVVVGLGSGTLGFFKNVHRAQEETGNPLSTAGAASLGATSALVACLVHSGVDFNMHVAANSLWAACLLGLIAAAKPVGSPAPSWLRKNGARWVAVTGGAAAALVLGFILVERAPVERASLGARNALRGGDLPRVIAIAQRAPGEEPGLAGALGQAWFEYPAWRSLLSPGDRPPGPDARFAFRESLGAFHRATLLQPQERVYWVGMARAAEEEGRKSVAEQAMIEAIARDPWHSYAWTAYADMIFDRGDNARARQLYEYGAILPRGDYARSRTIEMDEDASPSTPGTEVAP